MFGDRARPWGEVPVDGAWWVVVGDLGLNTMGARRMMTTMPIAVHASEDGSKLSILGVVPAPDCRGLCVIVVNGYVLFLLAWWCCKCLRLVDQ